MADHKFLSLTPAAPGTWAVFEGARVPGEYIARTVAALALVESGDEGFVFLVPITHRDAGRMLTADEVVGSELLWYGIASDEDNAVHAYLTEAALVGGAA